MWQEIIVALLVAVSGVYIGRRLYKSFKAGAAGENPCGCDCGAKGCGQAPSDNCQCSNTTR